MKVSVESHIRIRKLNMYTSKTYHALAPESFLSNSPNTFRATAESLPVTLVLSIRLFRASANHLSQFPLLGKFARKQAKVVDEVTACLDQCGARSKATVCLNAEKEGAISR